MADEPAQQSISDDQELAKVLAGVSQQVDDTSITSDDSSVGSSIPEPTLETEDMAMSPELPSLDTESYTNTPAPALDPVTPATMSNGGGELDNIKLEALQELRPLVDKLNVSAEEKFDTYLLLLRSTDDKALIAPAHEAAKGITDEARRAQALLDIIKEIDFLSQPKQ